MPSSRSLLEVNGETILPSIVGVKEPFHVAVARDETDPQFRSYRAYMEMMYSGLLTKEQVESIVRYRSKHHDTLLGMPTVYGYKTGILAGFWRMEAGTG
jgi:membrane-bound lytic murein transglycosylase B